MNPNTKQTTSGPQANQTPASISSAPQMETKNKIKSLMLWEIGVLEIGLVILVLIAFFGVLNYFNVLSLSSIYPNEFGFLPHQKILNNLRVAFNPTQAFNSYAPLNQASVDNIGKYYAYAKTNFAEPHYDNDAKSYVAEGIFAGYSDNFVTIITKNGSVDFAISDSSIFNREIPSSSSGSVSIFKKIAKENFNIKENLGKILQVNYSILSGGSKADQIIQAYILLDSPFVEKNSAEFEKYYEYASSHFDDPTYSEDQHSYSAEGVLSSYNDNLITLATPIGPMTFAITDKTYLRFLASSGEESVIIKNELQSKGNVGKNVVVFYLAAEENSNTYPLKKVYLLDTGTN